MVFMEDGRILINILKQDKKSMALDIFWKNFLQNRGLEQRWLNFSNVSTSAGLQDSQSGVDHF